MPLQTLLIYTMTTIMLYFDSTASAIIFYRVPLTINMVLYSQLHLQIDCRSSKIYFTIKAILGSTWLRRTEVPHYLQQSNQMSTGQNLDRISVLYKENLSRNGGSCKRWKLQRVSKKYSHILNFLGRILYNYKELDSSISLFKISIYNIFVAPHHLGILINVSNAIYFHYYKTIDEFKVNYGF